MLTASNLVFLILLAICSWIILCLINSGSNTSNNFYNAKEARDRSRDNWRLISAILAKSTNFTIYLVCTLIGVFILLNVISRKVKAVALVTSKGKDRHTALITEITRLRNENSSLLETLKGVENEKQTLIENLNAKTSIIQKLKGDLSYLKDCYDGMKLKLYKFTKQTENYFQKSLPSFESDFYTDHSSKASKAASSESLISRYFGGNNQKRTEKVYRSNTLTPSNHDMINKILREAYSRPKSVVLFKRSEDNLGKQNNDETISENCSQDSLMRDLENMVVSTYQLEQIKGLTKSPPCSNYFSDFLLYENKLNMDI